MMAQAIKYYQEGEECAKSILLAAAKEHEEVTEEVVATSGAISNGFGVGTICGCLISGLMVISVVLGEEEAKKKRLSLLMDFKDRFGSLNCASVCNCCCDCDEVIGFVCQWLENIGL